MASSILHVKDAFYFEVPKMLWRANYRSIDEFPDVWVRLDPEFQLWEARRLHAELERAIAVPPWPELRDEYLAWREQPGNFAKPLYRLLEEQYQQNRQQYRQWRDAPVEREDPSFAAYLQHAEAPYAWFSRPMAEGALRQWRQIRMAAGDVAAYKRTEAEWSQRKIDAYNHHLSGKVLIPQPPGVRLRNLYEVESGFAISQFLVIQFVVAIILVVLFSWLARKAASGERPRGRLWNLLELMLVYLRDNVARPTAGADGDRFVPLLWTIFVFVFGCNLCGLVPWVSAPTASFGVTTGLAGVVFAVGMFVGVQRFGPLGFFANQVPTMQLPTVLAVFIKPLLLTLELVGLGIRHVVLAIRLLANMLAGHLVLLGIMGLAFGASGALLFAEESLWMWGGTAFAAIIASTLYMCLELFVAVLQAYIFTFLSAVFIGAASHRH